MTTSSDVIHRDLGPHIHAVLRELGEDTRDDVLRDMIEEALGPDMDVEGDNAPGFGWLPKSADLKMALISVVLIAYSPEIGDGREVIQESLAEFLSRVGQHVEEVVEANESRADITEEQRAAVSRSAERIRKALKAAKS